MAMHKLILPATTLLTLILIMGVSYMWLLHCFHNGSVVNVQAFEDMKICCADTEVEVISTYMRARGTYYPSENLIKIRATAPEQVMVHEYAHAYSYAVGMPDELIQSVQSHKFLLSAEPYQLRSDLELVAQATAMYTCHPTTLKLVAPSVYNQVNTWLRQ